MPTSAYRLRHKPDSTRPIDSVSRSMAEGNDKKEVQYI